MIVCLSPNGSSDFSGETSPDVLLVATLDGVARAEFQDGKWRLAETSLSGLHISSILL